MVVSFARREYLLRSNYSTWHLCGGGQNETTSLKKACKNRSKRKKEKKKRLVVATRGCQILWVEMWRSQRGCVSCMGECDTAQWVLQQRD